MPLKLSCAAGLFQTETGGAGAGQAVVVAVFHAVVGTGEVGMSGSAERSSCLHDDLRPLFGLLLLLVLLVVVMVPLGGASDDVDA